MSFVCAEGLDALFGTVILALILFVERLHKSLYEQTFPAAVAHLRDIGLRTDLHHFEPAAVAQVDERDELFPHDERLTVVRVGHEAAQHDGVHGV